MRLLSFFLSFSPFRHHSNAFLISGTTLLQKIFAAFCSVMRDFRSIAIFAAQNIKKTSGYLLNDFKTRAYLHVSKSDQQNIYTFYS